MFWYELDDGRKSSEFNSLTEAIEEAHQNIIEWHSAEVTIFENDTPIVLLVHTVTTHVIGK